MPAAEEVEHGVVEDHQVVALQADEDRFSRRDGGVDLPHQRGQLRGRHPGAAADDRRVRHHGSLGRPRQVTRRQHQHGAGEEKHGDQGDRCRLAGCRPRRGPALEQERQQERGQRPGPDGVRRVGPGQHPVEGDHGADDQGRESGQLQRIGPLPEGAHEPPAPDAGEAGGEGQDRRTVVSLSERDASPRRIDRQSVDDQVEGDHRRSRQDDRRRPEEGGRDQGTEDVAEQGAARFRPAPQRDDISDQESRAQRHRELGPGEGGESG